MCIVPKVGNTFVSQNLIVTLQRVRRIYRTANMKMEVTNLMRELTGKALVLYCLESHPNNDFRQLAKLLFYATMQNIDTTASYLTRIVNGEVLITFYPAIDSKDLIKGKVLVGTIPDGCLYIG